MRKFSVFLCILMFLFICSNNLFAYSFDMGSDSYIDTSETNEVLKMTASVFDLDDITYNLEHNQSYTFGFAKIWTSESWINKDDLIPGTITAGIDFDSPDIFPEINGSSVGFRGCFKFVQGWELVWDDPIYIELQDGMLQIELSNAFYASGFWQGPDGKDCITATVTYTDSEPVPEPATMFLLGTGLVGFAGLRRKKMQK